MGKQKEKSAILFFPNLMKTSINKLTYTDSYFQLKIRKYSYNNWVNNYNTRLCCGQIAERHKAVSAISTISRFLEKDK